MRMVEVTILVPERDLLIDSTVTYEKEERHIQGGYQCSINELSIDGLDYKVQDYDIDLADQIAIDRFNDAPCYMDKRTQSI